MNLEQKLEAVQNQLNEIKSELEANKRKQEELKKRNWPEKIEPGMVFRCPIGTFLIRYRSHGPLGPINDWDLVEIFTGRYLSGEGGKFSGQEHEFTYLGHARDLIKIEDATHEPTGAELVGKLCQFSDDGKTWTKPGECDEFDPSDREMAYHSAVKLTLDGDDGRSWFEFARLAR